MLSPTHSAAERGRGWTLPELVVVIAILAIIAALAIPRGFNRDAFAARGYAVEVAGAARLSRTLASASGCAVQLTVDTAGYRARQRQPQGTHCAAAGAFNTAVKRADGSALQGTKPANLNFTSNLQWTFNSNNSAQLTGGTSASFGVHVVSADPQSGLISGP